MNNKQSRYRYSKKCVLNYRRFVLLRRTEITEPKVAAQFFDTSIPIRCTSHKNQSIQSISTDYNQNLLRLNYHTLLYYASVSLIHIHSHDLKNHFMHSIKPHQLNQHKKNLSEKQTEIVSHENSKEYFPASVSSVCYKFINYLIQ